MEYSILRVAKILIKQIHDTEDYDENLGKILIFYADNQGEISNVNITLRDLETNAKLYRAYITVEDQFFTFTINKSTFFNFANYTYIKYEVATNSPSEVYCFSGYFSTVIDEFEQQDLTNYSRIQNMNNNLKSDIMMWMLRNATYKKHFSDLKTGVTDSISNYIEGFVVELRGLGYSDMQIDEMKEVIADGYVSTQRTEKEQNLEIAQAEQRGWWSGVQLILMFIGVAIVLVVLWVFVKGKLRLPSFGRVKRKVEATEDLDIFGTGS